MHRSLDKQLARFDEDIERGNTAVEVPLSAKSAATRTCASTSELIGNNVC